MRFALLVALFITGLTACSDESLTIDQQSLLVNDARKLEEQGKYLMAAAEYSTVVNSPGPSSEFYKIAGNKSFQMSKNISSACRRIENEISQYFAAYGKYPDSLDIFRDKVSKDEISAFNEFKLVKSLDGKAGVLCYYQGPLNIKL